MLGITNCCSIAMGLVGNLATGVLLGATGSYRAGFVVPVLLYLSSFAAFMLLLRGQPLRLSSTSR